MTRRSSPRTPLPPALGTAFTHRAARSAGVSASRLRGPDVSHPFRGVATRARPHTVAQRCEAFSVRMTGRWWFSHATAAVLYRIPLPQRLERADRPLDVTVFAPRTPPAADGCLGHTISDPHTRVVDARPFPRLAPADVWCQLSTVLSREDLVAAGDYLLSGHPFDRPRAPLCSECELREAARRYRGKRGAKNLGWALARVRAGVDSRPESLLRLLLMGAGLPEPLIGDATPVDGGRLVLHPDLKLPQWRTVFEYEGDGHRDRAQWLSDVERYSLLRAAGWEVIQVTSDDIFRNPAKFLRRVAETLRRRGRVSP